MSVQRTQGPCLLLSQGTRTLCSQPGSPTSLMSNWRYEGMGSGHNTPIVFSLESRSTRPAEGQAGSHSCGDSAFIPVPWICRHGASQGLLLLWTPPHRPTTVDERLLPTYNKSSFLSVGVRFIY